MTNQLLSTKKTVVIESCLYSFIVKFLSSGIAAFYLSALALIAVKSLEVQKAIFFRQKKATGGSSFFAIEKKAFLHESL